MGTARTAFARASARLGVLSGIGAAVFLLAGLGTIVVDTLSGAAVGGLRAGLESASGAEGAARWQIRLAGDGEAQAEVAATVLDRLLVPEGATWARSVQTSPVEARAAGTEVGAVLLADEGIHDHARLIAGLWPDDPEAVDAASARAAAPTTLLDSAADELGLAPGDVVTPIREGRPLLIVGTWEPVDASDPRWFGEPILGGTVGAAAGPFVVAEATAVEADAPAFVRWTATVDAGLSPDRAAALRAVLPNVEPALRDEREIGSSGLSTLGGLPATLDRLLAGVGAVRAIAPLPMLLLAFAGAAALTRLAAILAASRRRETVLLRARGATSLRLARDTAVEVVVLGVPAAVLGVAAAGASVGLVSPGGVHDPVIPLLVASVAVVAAVVLVAGRAVVEARKPMLRGAGDEVGRMPRTALAGGATLIVVAAAIALWQFRLYGSPLVVTASGAREVDPVAVVAPVLALLALSIVVLALARPLAAALEHAAARRRSLVPALPLRQLARRASLYASASLVTTLAVSGLTLTALIAGSWQSIDRDVAALETGGDVRVVLPGRDLVRGPDPAATDDRFAVLDRVTADAPVFRGEVRVGADSALLVAGPASGLAAAAPGTGIGAASEALAQSAAAAAVELPPGAAVLEVPVEVRAPAGSTGRVSISAWILGPGGGASRLPAGEFDVASGGGTARVELADATRPRLLGLQASLAAVGGAEGVRVSFGPLELDGDAVAAEVSPTLELSSTEPEARATLTSGGEHLLPVVLSAELAERISADVGGEFAFRLVTGGTEIDAVVVGIVPTVPTAGGAALLVDLGALERVAFDAGGGVPQFGERWLATSDPDRVAAELDADRRSGLAVSTRADASSTPFIAPALAAMWVGSAGALAFALVALVALTSALAGSRFGEIAVLRAMGVPPRVQARARFAELAVAFGAAVVAGALAGGLTAGMTARELARAAIARPPDMLATALALDWAPWLLGVGTFIALAAAIALSAARAVRGLAGRPGLREEER